MKTRIAVVIPNWNGADFLLGCLGSLQNQSQQARIIVVDNGSTDDSVEIIDRKFSNVVLLQNKKNMGFAGGVNAGIQFAIENEAEMIALFNNDAVAEPNWLKNLVSAMEDDPKCGIVASKVLKKDSRLIDNTGECLSVWGLPFARSRDEKQGKTEPDEIVFGASGGSTLYRSEMLKEVGLFDEKFFAYYEDADMNFRAQLAGWKAKYAKSAIVHHEIGGTSGKIKGFTTYQTTKNLPMLFWKNVPLNLLPGMFPRFFIAYSAILASSILKGRGLPALKGYALSFKNTPHVLAERYKIQRAKKVSNKYIRSIIYNDLPPDAYKLRRLRRFFTGRS